MESFEPLSACKELENLEISGAYDFSDLTLLSPCSKLKKLVLRETSITDLAPVSSTPLLEQLDLSKNQDADDDSEDDSEDMDLSPLSQCTKLEVLELKGIRSIEDLSPLCQCPDLKKLCVSMLPLIEDLSFLEKGFTKLRVLDISFLELDDLSPLASLQNLEMLYCIDIPETTSILPLARCYKLQQIHCSDAAMDLAEFMEKRSDIKIIDGYDDGDEEEDSLDDEELMPISEAHKRMPISEARKREIWEQLQSEAMEPHMDQFMSLLPHKLLEGADGEFELDFEALDDPTLQRIDMFLRGIFGPQVGSPATDDDVTC